MRLRHAAVLAVALVPASAATASAPQITFKGVGKVKLGATYAHLRSAGLVGRIGPGCELEANSRSARLRAPLKGSVSFKHDKAHTVRSIQITGGSAKASGVGIGATIKQIKAAFPKAIVDHSTDKTFAFTLVVVPKNSTGQSGIAFAVDTNSHKASVIGVPTLESCE